MPAKKRYAHVQLRAFHPKPVHHHGLFGMGMLKRHWIIDNLWTQESLTTQFKTMKQLLQRRLDYNKEGAAAKRKRNAYLYRTLKAECFDGWTRLKNVLRDDNKLEIQRAFINHKSDKLLFSKMPINLVVEKADDKTFQMRKERDLLAARKKRLEAEYKSKARQAAAIKDRIVFENEFRLEEEFLIDEFRKRILNSQIRNNAIKTINGVYKKILQVLTSEAIYYDVILKSLKQDIDDQEALIQQVMQMGLPAMEDYKALTREARRKEERARRIMLDQLGTLRAYKKLLVAQKNECHTNKPKYNVTTTRSLLTLKRVHDVIAEVIKKINSATLTASAREIYPALSKKLRGNVELAQTIRQNITGYLVLEEKMKRVQPLEEILRNNLSAEEINRREKIAFLKKEIEEEDRIEAETLEGIKNKKDIFIILKYFLWNINAVLRHVGQTTMKGYLEYETSYLKLPFLHFEMHEMRAFPPDIYEDNIDGIMVDVKQKLKILMKAYTTQMSTEEMQQYVTEYQNTSIGSGQGGRRSSAFQDLPAQESTEDIGDKKNVPSYHQIKTQSAKIIEIEEAKKLLGGG